MSAGDGRGKNCMGFSSNMPVNVNRSAPMNFSTCRQYISVNKEILL